MTKIQLTFGMHLDSAPWSDNKASLGELRLGPFGMLSLLETRLGLTGPNVHPAERINQYMQRLKRCDRDGAYFHASFDRDVWSTARQMLTWRDELIEAGWRGEADSSCSPRLHSLAELERAELPLAMGREDRLREALHQLRQVDSVAIGRVFLLEDFESLPAVWQAIFSRLRDMGVSVEPVSAHTPEQHGQTFNLAVVRSALKGETAAGAISEGDDSLLLLKATDEWEAAENLALWLAAGVEENQNVTIICGGDTDVLDQALKRHSLPQLGSSESSHWRASLQILPLALANAWNPVDIHRLVELLSLPGAPVRRFAARRLLKAIGREPGVGGGAWNDALADIAAERERQLLEKGDKNAREKAAAEAQKLDAMLSGDRYPPEPGIPEEKLKERCQWVVEWLSWQAESEPLLGEAVSHAREMQKLAEGEGVILRVTVERMLDSVIGAGKVAPDRYQQAAPWRVVSHPGQITRPAGTVIWWGFADPPDHPATYWSDSERNFLQRFGVEPESSSAVRRREARAWRRGLDLARDHLLLFYPEQMHGEEAWHHPFWDEISSAASRVQPDDQPSDQPNEPEQAIACLMRECAGLQRAGHWRLAGRSVQLQKAPKCEPAAPVAVRAIRGEAILAPESLSFSKMSTMIGCPMKWVLQYHLGLKTSEALSVPSGSRMIGSFCHRIVEELYAGPVREWTPGEAESRAIELYDDLVGSMAAELLLEGNELEYARYRNDIGRAVKNLVAAINRHGLTVEKTEERMEGMVDSIPFVGVADLLLKDKDGNPFVLDLKWSTSAKYKQQEVEEGGALQLASYAWLLKAKGAAGKAHGGYFMLAQGELLSDCPLFGEDALDSERSLQETWEMGARGWKRRFRDLQSGQLEVSGVRERLMQAERGLRPEKAQSELKSESGAQGLLYVEPPCRFCDFAGLCGLAEVGP